VKIIRILLSASLFLLTIYGSVSADSGKLNPSLRYLKHVRSAAAAGMRGATAAGVKHERPGLAEAQADRVTVTIKFDHVLSPAERATLERGGAGFFSVGDAVSRTGAIYPITLPWNLVDELAGRGDVLKIDSAWRPAVLPLLDVSAHEIEADSTWRQQDPLGFPLTGKGMRIADFDTGIDVFHPSFFYADGDTFNWIDVDGFGTFTPGLDCVDLNRNAVADANETIAYFDGWIYDPAFVWGGGYPSNAGNDYQTYWDWLYNDANNNGSRNYGPGAGYTESSPTFGEQILIALDSNDNGVLNFGEKLVALKTSKIYATYTMGQVERVRGVDLIMNEADANGHGTSVSGILAGGTPGRHIFTGIAPDAEILMGYFFSNIPISALIPWARSRGADAMLYEFGSFVWDYLDGSSLDEELITAENDSIIQITPSGNLARGRKHAIATAAAHDSISFGITVPALAAPGIGYMYSTALWRTEADDLVFRLRSPLGGTATLSTGNDANLDGYYIYFERSTSPRGTCAFNIYIDCNENVNLNGAWTLKAVNGTAGAIEIICNVSDNMTSWAGGAEFSNYYTNDRNVTWPATADDAFVNGSYSTRGFEGYGGVGSGSISPGEISAFSGRGARIDGLHLLDVCSPGNYDVYSTRSSQDGSGYGVGCYRQFSGTSAAGPHVAAAAALVQQAFPEATMEDVAYLLTTHAAADANTGAVYNDTWGWGKLRILGAVGVATGVEAILFGDGPPRVLLDQNYPNPFNPSTWIPFYLPGDGLASVKIYDIRGGLVKVLKDGWMTMGAHSVRWEGDGGAGEQAASGIYFCVLRFGGVTETRKLVLLR